MKSLLWVCKDENCQNEVMASTMPMSLDWDDGHRCKYELKLDPIELEDLPVQLVMKGYAEGKTTIATVTLMAWGNGYRVKLVITIDDPADSRCIKNSDIEYDELDFAITVYRLTITGLAMGRYEAKGERHGNQIGGTDPDHKHAEA